MDATAVQQQQQHHRPLFDAPTVTNLKPRISSSNGTVPDANKVTKEGGSVAPADPAALRARLKHRATPSPSSSSSSSTTTAYDRVLDTAQRLASLEHQRSQDQIYIRTLEQTRTTLMRDAQSATRARAEAERALAGERDARVARDEALGERDEAVRAAVAERARAEVAEGRVGEIERRLGVCGERVRVLESELEGERKWRAEWESGLEALTT